MGRAPVIAVPVSLTKGYYVRPGTRSPLQFGWEGFVMGFIRAVSIFAAVVLTSAIANVGVAIAGQSPITIIDIGDSYITGYGIQPPAEGFRARLETALNARGHSVVVVDTGFQRTSTSGLQWLTKSDAAKKLFADHANYAVILELGSNDCSEFDAQKTRANLDTILAQFAEKHIPVLVVGTTPYTYCADVRGPDYAAAYNQIFPDLAKQYGNLLYADFKDGLTGNPELLQGDHDHPNSKGEAIIVERMLPSVEALIERLPE